MSEATYRKRLLSRNDVICRIRTAVLPDHIKNRAVALDMGLTQRDAGWLGVHGEMVAVQHAYPYSAGILDYIDENVTGDSDEYESLLLTAAAYIHNFEGGEHEAT